MVTLAIVSLVVSGLLGLLWSQQRRLIYFPSTAPVPAASAVLPDAREVIISTEDELDLNAWFLPGPRGPAVLILGGNAGDRSVRAPLADALHQLGLSVLLIDYRGYGGNPGRPSEEGLAADARAARDWLAAQPDVDRDRIAYFGESLGGAVAVGLAVEHQPAALILRSPFTSLGDVARVHYPWLPTNLLLRDRYPSIDRIPELSSPVLVIAGDADDIVPASLSTRLYEAAPEPKEMLSVPGLGHNDRGLLDGQQMLSTIEQFLQHTPVLGPGA
ncbi:alpha/beta hydrolase [Mycobacterium sp. SMC-4]|uniref:alpha/beta hydrolase n=1 Tax=Mycobacterium sp. SMC-4 TaxID=2857059 RepID=UPI0021B23048|nr:alpha/beta hydrolase [Mycobacterium sp. SMC-4]